MRKRDHQVFSIALLDILSGALGAVIILFVAVPKANIATENQNGRAPQSQSCKRKVENKLSSKMSVVQQEKQLNRELASVKMQIESIKAERDAAKKENEELQSTVNKLVKLEEEKKDQSEKQGIPVDVGFRFKGKRIVFLIDVSGSMVMEDRIGQVKAGLKMLITSMGREFQIDVVQFPSNYNFSYKSLWGDLNSVSEDNKVHIYNFLFNLRPYGATPTRDVLTYALENYPHLTDIVLLSDGAPTVKSGKHEDDIEDVLRVVRKKNNRKIQINTIGVGSDFLRDQYNTKYIFLKKLAEQNKGFFYGF